MQSAKTVLLIDDAVTVRLYHRQFIEQLGYQVDEAENGLEAMEKALQHTYDLFLVDINMPKMDGYTFLREVRSTPALAPIPAIMISTESEMHDKQRAFEVGANFYMVKPSQKDELQRTVALLIGE